jgi:hypothetical protein
VDFDLAGCKDVYSTAFIAVGKKCYVDKLEGTDVVTGEQRSGWHIRCKGVVDDAIEALAEATGKTPLELYQHMFDGGPSRRFTRSTEAPPTRTSRTPGRTRTPPTRTP